MRCHSMLIALPAIMLVAAPAFAKSGTFPRPEGGTVTESSDVAGTATVNLTDDASKVINTNGWPRTHQLKQKNGKGKFTTTFTIPQNVLIKGGGGERTVVTDVTQDMTLEDNDDHKIAFPGPQATFGAGADSNLSIEAVVFDSGTNTYQLESDFGVIGSTLGDNHEVDIPDLFADTNGNGTLGPGDTLYSLVDLNQYLTGIPTFTFGDTFHVVNGTVAGLPGMYFSTTPFTFTSSNGFGISGFGPGLVLGGGGIEPQLGGGYTGDAEVLASHGLTSTPEPASIAAFGTGALGLVTLALRRRRIR